MLYSKLYTIKFITIKLMYLNNNKFIYYNN